MRRILLMAVVAAHASLASAGEDGKKNFHFVNLQSNANQNRGESLGSGVPGNNLSSLPGGESEFNGVRFKVEDGILHLGSTILDARPEKVSDIKVDAKCSKLHFLHATCFGGGPNQEGSPLYVKDGTTIGEYVLTFDDKSTVSIPIVYGENVRDWFYVEGEPGIQRGKIAWNGVNERAPEVGAKIRLYQTDWKNTYPDKKILTIDYVGRKNDTPAAPFCVAITLED